MAAPYLANYGRAVNQGPVNYSGTGVDPNAVQRTSPYTQPMMAGQAQQPQPVAAPAGAPKMPATAGAIPPPNIPQQPTGLQAAPTPSTAGMAKQPMPQAGGVQMGQQQGMTIGPGPNAPPAPGPNAPPAPPSPRRVADTVADKVRDATHDDEGNTNTPGETAKEVANDAKGNVQYGWEVLDDKSGGRLPNDPTNPNDWDAERQRLMAEIEALKNRGMSSAQDLANQIQNTTSQTFNPTINMPDPTAGLRDMFSGAMGNLGQFNIGMFLNALGLGNLMGGGGGGGGGFSGFPGMGGMGGGTSAGAQGGGYGQGGFGQSNSQTMTSQWGNRTHTGQGAQYGGQGSAAQNNVGGRRQALSFAGQGSGFSAATGPAAYQQGGGLSRGGQVPPPGGMTRQSPAFGGPGMEPVQGMPTAQGAMQASMPARAPAQQGGLSGGGMLTGVPQPQMGQAAGQPTMMAYSGGGPGISQQGLAGLQRAMSPGLQMAGGAQRPQLGVPPPGGSGGGASGPRDGGGGGSGPRQDDGSYRNGEGQGGQAQEPEEQENTNGRAAPNPPGPPGHVGYSPGSDYDRPINQNPGSGWGPENGMTRAEALRQDAANNQSAHNGVTDPLSTLSNFMSTTDIGRYQSMFDPFNTYNRDANSALRSQIDDYGEGNIRMGQRAEDAARQSMLGQVNNERNAQQRMLDARAARGGMSSAAAQNSIYQNAANAMAEGERGLAQDAYAREMGRLSGLGAARGNLASSLTQGNLLDYENLMSQYTSNKDSMNNLMGFLSTLGEIVPF